MPVDFSRPVQTRDGRKVRILCTDRKGVGAYSVIGLVSQDNDAESLTEWRIDGTGGYHTASGVHFKERELVNVPEKIKGWRNTWIDGNGNLKTSMHTCDGYARDSADRNSDYQTYLEIAQPVEYEVPEE